jgi:hypothetical protein
VDPVSWRQSTLRTYRFLELSEENGDGIASCTLKQVIGSTVIISLLILTKLSRINGTVSRTVTRIPNVGKGCPFYLVLIKVA